MTDGLIPCKHMFSNGTEYELFLEHCFECVRFRNWKCRVLSACEKARFVGESAFPFGDLLEWEHYGGKVCKHFSTEKIKRLQKKAVVFPGQMDLFEEDTE